MQDRNPPIRGGGAGRFGVSRCLPVKWRREFKVATVFLETGTVTGTCFRAGLSVKF